MSGQRASSMSSKGDPLSGLAAFDTTPVTKRRAMTLEEIHKLLEKCAPERRFRYEVAFTSGLRAGELRSLRVSHLDVQRNGLQVDAAWTKKRKPGFQPLPGWLVEKLAKESKGKDSDAPLLFVSTHTARDLDEDLESAGIPKWRPSGKLDFHACRVAFVTFILEARASVKEAQALARHSIPGLTMNTYGRTRDDRLAEVAEVVGRTLQGQSRNTTGAQLRMAASATPVFAKGSVVEAAGVEPAA